MHYPPDRPPSPATAPVICYTMLRYLGHILNEISTQGIDLWCDEQRAWHWRWLDTDMQAQHGLWSLGDALVDAVATRYPHAFQPPPSEVSDDKMTR
jgi:hypothetical protein